MRLISCHIENFGKLHDITYNFNEHLNIILKDNGWGKSTFVTFIKVMLFGFENESKRKVIERERGKFAPWNGKVYGGQLVFESNGRQYRIERTFGSKEKEDSFALYDNVTNLLTNDFKMGNGNIGEELFNINRESFGNTVFIAQLNCKTSVTDDIYAKIGNVSSDISDMSQYEIVQSKLKKELDRLTPHRKSGELYKLNDEINKLNAEIKNKDVQKNALHNLQNQLEKLNSRKEELQKDDNNIQDEIRKLSSIKDSKVLLQKYNELKSVKLQAMYRLKEEQNLFPVRIPQMDEVDQYIKYQTSAMVYKENAANYSLDETQKSRLIELNKKFSKGIPNEEVMDDLEKKIETLQVYEKQINENTLSQNEMKELNYLSQVFKNGLPDAQYLDSLIEKWEERKNRKNNINAKSNLLQTVKSVNEAPKRSISKIVKIIKVILAIFIIFIGVIGCFSVLPLGIIFIAIGVALLLKKKPSLSKKKEELCQCEDYEEEIAKDTEFVQYVDKEISEFMNNFQGDVSEQKVSESLYLLKNQVEKYNKLMFMYQECNKAEDIQTYDNLKSKIMQVLEMYCEDVTQCDYLKVFMDLKNLVSEYKNLVLRAQKNQEQLNKYFAMSAEVKNFLNSLGITENDDAGNVLRAIGDRLNKIEFLNKDMEEKTEAINDFEKHNNISLLLHNDTLPSVEKTSEELVDLSQSMKKKIDDVKDEILGNRQSQNAVMTELDRIDECEENLIKTKENYEELHHRYDILGKTRDYLEKAKINFSSKYMDPVKQSFDKYYGMIAKNDDKKYQLDANLNMSLTECGGQREIELLSEGYQDLVGICRRMAMIDAMYEKEKPFILLDDPFVNFDSKKMEGALKFMDEISKEYQVIYMTCHESRKID
ncbi:Uncharacterized protein YhaN [Hathewaya proteolytica DSM 3090]|uniref:Uncharacterized protein YhaN n=1 Tax=Hathewaya proteolytica DSM 3090 TaxID=1121331 RepID=A0A1M6KIA8_9CLOT|nr:AAA family ATPase [Hathewaya proteolytica]SHJ58649.1 Uncharacterized protein YhaN [Hathewaya proteolytica DSM 3090]